MFFSAFIAVSLPHDQLYVSFVFLCVQVTVEAVLHTPHDHMMIGQLCTIAIIINTRAMSRNDNNVPCSSFKAMLTTGFELSLS